MYNGGLRGRDKLTLVAFYQYGTLTFTKRDAKQYESVICSVIDSLLSCIADMAHVALLRTACFPIMAAYMYLTCSCLSVIGGP